MPIFFSLFSLNNRGLQLVVTAGTPTERHPLDLRRFLGRPPRELRSVPSALQNALHAMYVEL